MRGGGEKQEEEEVGREEEEEAGQEAEAGQEEEVGLPTRCWRRRPARPSPPRCPNAKWRPGSGRWRPVGLPELLGGGLQLYGCGGLPGKGESSKGKGPALSSRIPQLYGWGGSPGLASPPSNPSARSIPSTATTLWLWRSSRPTQSSQQALCPL